MSMEVLLVGGCQAISPRPFRGCERTSLLIPIGLNGKSALPTIGDT